MEALVYAAQAWGVLPSQHGEGQGADGVTGSRQVEETSVEMGMPSWQGTHLPFPGWSVTVYV